MALLKLNASVLLKIMFLYDIVSIYFNSKMSDVPKVFIQFAVL